MAKLKKNGVRVLSARENISDDASGVMYTGGFAVADIIRYLNNHQIKTRLGNLNDIHYRQSLVDVFIGRIELFNDHMIIYYNSHDGQITNIPVDEPDKVRLRGVVVDPVGIEPMTSALRTRRSPS